MSQLDRELKGTKIGSAIASAQVTDFNMIMSQDIGQVTSRDQIIDPYSLVNPANYRKTRAGQAQYNSDLQQALRYAEMQEAAFQEWYNDPAQVAARERAAGLNPDLVGLDNGGSASDTEINPTSPIAGIPTNGEIAKGWIDTALGFVNAASTAAGAVKGFAMMPEEKALLAAQADSLEMGSVMQFQSLAFDDISSRLADAVSAAAAAGDSAFDVASWLADDANFDSSGFLSAFAPSDSPRYAAAYSRARQYAQKYLAPAYSMNTDSLAAEMSTAKELAYAKSTGGHFINRINYNKPLMAMIANTQRLIVAYNEKQAEIDKRLAEGYDVDTAIDAANSRLAADVAMNDYNNVYYGNLDGVRNANSETLYREATSLMLRAQQAIKENYFATWREMGNTPEGMTAADIVLDGSIFGSPFAAQYHLLGDDFVTYLNNMNDIEYRSLRRQFKWLPVNNTVDNLTKAGNMVANIIGSVKGFGFAPITTQNESHSVSEIYSR